VSGRLHAPSALPPGKGRRYPLDEPQSRSRRSVYKVTILYSNEYPHILSSTHESLHLLRILTRKKTISKLL